MSTYYIYCVNAFVFYQCKDVSNKRQLFLRHTQAAPRRKTFSFSDKHLAIQDCRKKKILLSRRSHVSFFLSCGFLSVVHGFKGHITLLLTPDIVLI